MEINKKCLFTKKKKLVVPEGVYICLELRAVGLGTMRSQWPVNCIFRNPS